MYSNSCHSQMSEAIANAHLAQKLRVFSAVAELVGYVHPLEIKALKEIYIHHEGRSKSVC